MPDEYIWPVLAYSAQKRLKISSQMLHPAATGGLVARAVAQAVVETGAGTFGQPRRNEPPLMMITFVTTL
jgi:hypothetical protein